jgi:hypothetical protein
LSTRSQNFVFARPRIEMLLDHLARGGLVTCFGHGKIAEQLARSNVSRTPRRRDIKCDRLAKHAQRRLVVLPEVVPSMIDKLTITRMINRFDSGDSSCQTRTVLFDVLEQFRLCVGRAGDQDHAGIGNRFSHPLEKVVILSSMPTTETIGFVMQVPGRMIRMDDELVGVRCVEMEHAGFAMIYPNHGMIMR